MRGAWVCIATHCFSHYGAVTVYGMTLLASLGGCAAYIFFIGKRVVVRGRSIDWSLHPPLGHC